MPRRSETIGSTKTPQRQRPRATKVKNFQNRNCDSCCSTSRNCVQVAGAFPFVLVLDFFIVYCNCTAVMVARNVDNHLTECEISKGKIRQDEKSRFIGSGLCLSVIRVNGTDSSTTSKATLSNSTRPFPDT